MMPESSFAAFVSPRSGAEPFHTDSDQPLHSAPDPGEGNSTPFALAWLDGLPLPAVVLGPRLELVAGNAAAVDLLHLAENDRDLPFDFYCDIIGDDGQKIAPENRPCTESLKQFGTVQETVMGILHSHTNRRVWTLTRAQAHYDANGEPQVVCTFLDITELRQKDADRRRTETQATHVLERTTEGFFTLDRNGCFTYINGRAATMFHRPAAEMIGRNVWDEFPALADSSLSLSYQNLIAEGTPISVCAFFAPRRAWIEIQAYKTEDTVSVFFQDVTTFKNTERKLRRSLARLKRGMEGVVKAMAYLVEIRDPYTAGHQRRVSILACAIAKEMALTEAQVEVVRVAGLLHDIGKVAIPAEILSKPGRLTRPEFSMIQAHPQTGYEILRGIALPPQIAQVALQHHERLDGSGYPQNLRGEQILLESRIMAVADVVEAMASHRPYRPALGVAQALREIEPFRGTRYDSDVVNACIKVFLRHKLNFEAVLRANAECDPGDAFSPPESQP